MIFQAAKIKFKCYLLNVGEHLYKKIFFNFLKNTKLTDAENRLEVARSGSEYRQNG